jgi:chemotaxis protein methyltransferase CheR
MSARDDYVDFCEGVREVTGMDLASYKRPQMERRIRAFAQAQHGVELPEYLGELRRSPDARERFLDRMTINVSELFRNPEQYEQLRARALAPLRGVERTVRLWSAGCSYGAEAYTLACLALDELGRGAPCEVVGSDIDRRMLARAVQGRFGPEDARSVPAATLRLHFRRVDDGYEASPELRARCRFVHQDLLRSSPGGGWDVIACRNVVIYLTESTRDQVHASLAQALRPGGHLMVGATERVARAHDLGLEPVAPFVYRRAAG